MAVTIDPTPAKKGKPPPNGASADAVQSPARRRHLGMWTATALVVGNMIGSGVFLIPARLAAGAARWTRFGVGCRAPTVVVRPGRRSRS